VDIKTKKVTFEINRKQEYAADMEPEAFEKILAIINSKNDKTGGED
jgi:hypothetical protein